MESMYHVHNFFFLYNNRKVIQKVNVSTSFDAVGLKLGVKSLVVTSMGEEYSKLDNSRIEKHIEDLQKNYL